MKTAVVAALATTVTGFPASRAADAGSPQLIKTSSDADAFDGLWMTSYHIGAGLAYAVLVPNDPSLPNGGADPMILDGPAGDQDVLFQNGPNGTIAEGLVIPGDNEAMLIQSGQGTSDFLTAPFSPPVLEFTGSATNHFYACPNSTLPSGPAIQVFHISDLVITPDHCAVVDFLLFPATD